MGLKRTPLYPRHKALGAKLVEFGGWEMPVQYSGIIDEHKAVRGACGIFDISHMGEIRVKGELAEPFLNHVLTNDIRKISVGEGQYTLMCNEKGGTIDDLYVYRLEKSDYLLIVNASRIDVDWEWIRQQHGRLSPSAGVAIEDVSERWGALALQGPRSIKFIDDCFRGTSTSGTPAGKPTSLQKNQIGLFPFEKESVWIARTGYTGEDGFEIFAAADRIADVWAELLSQGHKGCLQPVGLGARDTLRTEMGYPLYGHELDGDTSPIEAGLGFFVAMHKGDFIGRDRLAAQKDSGVSKKCVAFRMNGKSAPPRPGYQVWSPDFSMQPIGSVTSGTQSPSLGMGIGMAYVEAASAVAGTEIEIEIRGRRAPARIVKKPIYRKDRQY